MIDMTYVLDCPSPRELGAFYATLFGWEVKDEDDEWVTLSGISGATLAFQRSPEYRPSTWPSPEVHQMTHIDFRVSDRAAAHAKALELGAKVLDDRSSGFTVYADPAGHPFCLCDS